VKILTCKRSADAVATAREIAVVLMLLLCSYGCRANAGHDQGHETGHHADHAEQDSHNHHGGHGGHGGHGDHGDHGHDDSIAPGHHRTVIKAAAAAASGIRVAKARPMQLESSVELHGRILPNQDRLLHVAPRYPGVVVEVRKRLGEAVAAGETLAVIESNQSLERYEVRSGIAGTVLVKNLALGEFVRQQDDLYVIADLSTVWADFDVYRRLADRIRPGVAVTFESAPESAPMTALIEWVSPIGAPLTQTLLARAVLDNSSGSWRPGMFVNGHVAVATVHAGVAVDRRALQTLEGRPVIFVRNGDVYTARSVSIGLDAGRFIEIVSGLKAGEEYVVENSFIIKSALGAGNVEHSH
jgi:cobalt-zinc-cadmium efflux system membrane fusion protein